ncbi:MAG: HNH endonuclease [Anaerolineales bacterium]|nr:HNH endonuclease [Anaerolineales bacterium]
MPRIEQVIEQTVRRVVEGQSVPAQDQTKTQLQVHHIIPKEQGGNDSLENLITLCTSCHQTTHRSLMMEQRKAIW